MLILTFTPLAPSSAQSIIDLASGLIAPAEYSADKTVVSAAHLPFYPGIMLYALSDTTLPEPNTRYILSFEDQTLGLDWTNEPIYAVNEALPIVLNEETIIPYAFFFFHFVRGQLGRFIIVEHVDQITWRPDASDDIKADVSARLIPVTYRGIGPEGAHVLVATVTFRDALFRTSIKIFPRAVELTDSDTGITETTSMGQMLLSDEILLFENLPILVPEPPGEFG